jgi:hypothetical protein
VIGGSRICLNLPAGADSAARPPARRAEADTDLM